MPRPWIAPFQPAPACEAVPLDWLVDTYPELEHLDKLTSFPFEQLYAHLCDSRCKSGLSMINVANCAHV